MSKIGLYFNGRLMDITRNTYSENKEFLSVDKKGRYYIETYNNGWPNAAVACPSTSWWRNTIVNLTVKAVPDYNISLVCLDQMVLAPRVLDFGENHGHPPSLRGSLGWWT